MKVVVTLSSDNVVNFKIDLFLATPVGERRDDMEWKIS